MSSPSSRLWIEAAKKVGAGQTEPTRLGDEFTLPIGKFISWQWVPIAMPLT